MKLFLILTISFVCDFVKNWCLFSKADGKDKGGKTAAKINMLLNYSHRAKSDVDITCKLPQYCVSGFEKNIEFFSENQAIRFC